MRHFVKIGSSLRENMGNILIIFTLIMAPVLCFCKGMMEKSINLYIGYYILNMLVIIINSVYLVLCRPSLNKWELWVSLFLIIVALLWLYRS